MKPAIALIVTIACGACATEESREPVDCDPFQVASGGDLVEGALTIGTGDPESFQPIARGGTVELTLGNQGGWMVTVTLRVDAASMVAQCVGLGVDVVVPESAVSGADWRAVPLQEVDGYWYSDPIPVFLSLDLDQLEGRAAIISSGVDDGAAAAAVEVDAVTLVNAE